MFRTPGELALGQMIRETLAKGTVVKKSTSGDKSPVSYSSDSDSDSSDFDAPGSNLFKDSKNKLYKFIDPCYWSGYRWSETGKMRISCLYQKTEFTIISWNVWFGYRNRNARMIALGNVIKSYRPDFIALQEVTSDLLPLILQQTWAHEYFVSDTTAKFTETYGNVMLSRVSFKECVLHKLESRLGRKAMLGNFSVSGQSSVVMGTFHLESYLEDAPYRAAQLKTFQKLTETFPNVILVGDTNFTSDEESASLGERFSDAWKVLYQATPEDAKNNPGLTFDTETNSMAKEEYQAQNMDDPKSVRLDRCFYTHQTIQPLEMKILGTSPYMQQEFISDHYGIFIRLRLI